MEVEGKKKPKKDQNPIARIGEPELHSKYIRFAHELAAAGAESSEALNPAAEVASSRT
jgi:hypothetical protein